MLILSIILAIISAIFVPPDINYIKYIDLRTLALLFCLMGVVSGFTSQGVFMLLCRRLVKITKSTRGIAFVLVFLNFFLSMLITNDVSLITFVPFAIMLLNMCGMKEYIIYIVVLQTIAANLGSTLTPIGNPQNLYLYEMAHMTAGELVMLMLPYSILAMIMLIIACMFIKDRKIVVEMQTDQEYEPTPAKLAVYIVLFALSLLTVLHVIPYYITLIITALAIALVDRNVLKQIDYSLLLTFTALFIFIGNLGRVPVIKDFLISAVTGHEVITGVIASQIFSNVPAAILLGGFTDNIRKLIIGVNIGGLGTLIASMASLISYKLYTRENKDRTKYMLCFTLLNIIFLVAELMLCFIS